MAKHTHNKSTEFLTKLVKIADEIILDDKARDERIQDFLFDFLSSYNDPDLLAKNSTPLSHLLKGLKRTDATLIKIYIEEVTNAKIGLNDKNKLVIKLEKDQDLDFIEDWTALKWYDMAKDTVTVRKESYDDINQAIKAYKKWCRKVAKSGFDGEEFAKAVMAAQEEVEQEFEVKE